MRSSLIILILVFSIFAEGTSSQEKKQTLNSKPLTFQNFSQLHDYLLKTKNWRLQDLVVETIETQKKLSATSLHDIAITNKSLCGSGGCPYIVVARTLSPEGLSASIISNEFFGEFRILPSVSSGRFDLALISKMGSDTQSKKTLKFNGRIYD